MSGGGAVIAAAIIKTSEDAFVIAPGGNLWATSGVDFFVVAKFFNNLNGFTRSHIVHELPVQHHDRGKVTGGVAFHALQCESTIFGGAFAIETEIVIDMRTDEDGGKPPCSMARRDSAKGKLVYDGEVVTSLSGTLAYAFTPTADSSCGDLVDSEMPVFAAIPCAMAYTFTAARTGD